MHLTGPDLIFIGGVYGIGAFVIAALWRAPRNLSTPAASPHPLVVVGLAVSMITVLTLFVATAVDPAAAATLARLLP